MKDLVIVESPSKSKTIEKYLGKNYEVVSSKGHIRDLAIKGKDGLGVEVDNHFKPTYVISDDKKDVVADLKKRADRSNKVYLATDPDREGEAISWHLAEVLGLDINEVERVVFHEITHDAVIKAFDAPRAIDMGLVRSQETRRILDRIIGFKLSKLLNSKIKSKSAGRVQSVALKLIVDKEKEIEAFVPEEYWSLDGIFDKEGKQFPASLAKINGKKAVLKTQEDAEKAYEACQGQFVVTSVKQQVRKREAKPPFITSTLQQEASTKLNMSAKKTMSVAQRLYEGIQLASEQEGLITYMRTDSTRLSDVFVKAAQAKIVNEYGKEYLGSYRVKNDDNSQDAHEGIRPTNLKNTPESVKPYLTAEQYRLYKMIYARALASLMAPAKNNTVAVTLSNEGYDFSANGTVQVFDGYLKVYGAYETNKDVLLPDLKEKDLVKCIKIDRNQHFTEPPARYTEAKLIRQMEEEGIGRPSTYAMIIDTIQARGYVSLEKSSENSKTKVFIPSEQGRLTSEMLDQYFNKIINVKYTANMELELDEIADGKQDNEESLQKFWDEFIPLVDNAYENMEKVAPVKTGQKCPECGGDLVIRVGRYGKFISCDKYPECKYTERMEKEEKNQPTPTGEKCPECGGDLVERMGRFGKFVSCSNYPECKYIVKGAKEKPEETGKACPQCGSPLVKRKSRYGKYFIGCSTYPKCRYMENEDGSAIGTKTTKKTTKKTTSKKTTRKKAA